MRVLGNTLWLVLAGVWLAIGYAIAGIISFILIITIPFGVQAFKLAGYALWPFGRVVVARDDSDEGLSILGNVLWIVFAGWWLALAHIAVGFVLCVTIIGIPFGIASFKMAGLAIAPFGREVVDADHPDALVAPRVTTVRPLGEPTVAATQRGAAT